MQKGSEKQSFSRYRDSSLYTREPIEAFVQIGVWALPEAFVIQMRNLR